MDVKQLVVPKEEAEQAFNEYRELFKNRAHMQKNQVLRDLKAIYGHMRHGRAVIDIYRAFKDAGLNDDGDPKLAVCKADAKIVFLQKQRDGAAVFRYEDDWWHTPRKQDVVLPEETFDWPKGQYGQIQNERRQALVPIVPAKFLLEDAGRYALKNLHLIWEVDEWKAVPPRDPILTRRITPNIFVVLATWELTPLERAVIMGRLEG